MKPKSPPEPLLQNEPHTVKVIRLKKADCATPEAMAARYRVNNLTHFLEGILCVEDQKANEEGTVVCDRVTVLKLEMTATPQRDHTDGARAAWYCLRSQLKREHIAVVRLPMLVGVPVFFPRIKFERGDSPAGCITL